jgi:hypothetical protein
MQKYLFIDGGYLRKVLDNYSSTFWGGDPLPVEYERLSTGYRKCFYYDCAPPIRANENPADHEQRVETQR